MYDLFFQSCDSLFAHLSLSLGELRRKRRTKLRDYKKQLEEVDKLRQKLETRGVELEQTIRQDDNSNNSY